MLEGKLFRPRGYFRPATVRETVSLLAKYGESARPIAGGTDVLVSKNPDIEYLIDISRLHLDYITKGEKDVRIGALSTFRSIETSPLLLEEGPYSALIEATKAFSPTIRNVATIGGNVCSAVPSADSPPALMILDAKVKTFSLEGERIIPLVDFFLGVRKTALKVGELLTEIQISRFSVCTGTAFLRLGRTEEDIALANAAARVTLGSDGVCVESRVALGGVAPTPFRVKRAEILLDGKKIDDNLIEEAARIASEETKPSTRARARASADYRREISKVLMRRALKQALKRAKGD